jgi:hypothetical protein
MKNPLRQALLLSCLLAVALDATAEETDLNPIDGSVHTTERWETYEPQGGRRACAEKVCLESVRGVAMPLAGKHINEYSDLFRMFA